MTDEKESRADLGDQIDEVRGDASPPADGRGAEQSDLNPRPDPWKGFRGVCSGILILEMITVLLAVPVVENLSSFQGPGWAPTTFVLCYAALLFWACAVQKRPWALSLDLGLQIVLVAGWFLHPAIGITGLVFVVVWGIVWWMRRAVQRAQGARYED